MINSYLRKPGFLPIFIWRWLLNRKIEKPWALASDPEKEKGLLRAEEIIDNANIDWVKPKSEPNKEFSE